MEQKEAAPPASQLLRDIKIIIDQENTLDTKFDAMIYTALANYHMKLAGSEPVYEVKDFYA
jgi:hypothetical protein